MIYKYIMTEMGPVIASPAISHAHIEIKEQIPISAGFVKFYTNEYGQIRVKCYGESERIGLSSRKEDVGMFEVFGSILNS